MDLNKNCTKYVAFLRALYLLHQNHHWLSQGANFYGNHLLFERIYKSAEENADLAAEKFIGLFGAEAIDIKSQPALIQEFLDKYSSSGDLVTSSCEAEKFFLEFSKAFYTELKKDSDKLSLGLDDAIMTIANDRETSVYLLKQTSGTEMNKISTLANKFQIKLAAEIVTDEQYARLITAMEGTLSFFKRNNQFAMIWGNKYDEYINGLKAKSLEAKDIDFIKQRLTLLANVMESVVTSCRAAI